MQLRRLAAERRDADRVLEQPAGVRVVRRPASPAGAAATRGSRRPRRNASPRPRDRDATISAARNSRKPSSSSASRRIAGAKSAGSASGAASSVRTSSWSRSRKCSTRPSTRTASPSAKRPSSSSTSFQTRASIRPLGSTSSSARYGAPPLRPQPLLARDRVDAFDDPVLRQLCDRAHGASLGPRTDARVVPRWPWSSRSGRSATTAERRPARAARRAAVRRHLARAARGAPPRSPYNVVHLTLPDSEDEAGARLAELAGARTSSSATRSPAYWWLSQEYVGPDGVAPHARASSRRCGPSRTRTGVVLPHERTHARPEGGPAAAAARDARRSSSRSSSSGTATDRAARPRRARPARAAATQLWRLEPTASSRLARRAAPDRRRPSPLRDGARLRARTDGSPWLMVVIVPTRPGGADDLPDAPRRASRQRRAGHADRRAAATSFPGVVLYRDGRYELLDGDGLDAEVVERSRRRA